MKTVKITNSCGYHDGGFIRLGERGQVVNLEDAEAKRLVDVKAAIFLDSIVPSSPVIAVEKVETAKPTIDESAEDGTQGTGRKALNRMTKLELMAVADGLGIDVDNLKTRNDLIAAITDATEPKLSVEDIVV